MTGPTATAAIKEKYTATTRILLDIRHQHDLQPISVEDVHHQ
jgi:hypothetical protein